MKPYISKMAQIPSQATTDLFLLKPKGKSWLNYPNQTKLENFKYPSSTEFILTSVHYNDPKILKIILIKTIEIE